MQTRPNPQPALLNIVDIGHKLFVTWDQDIAYGDTTDRDAWIIQSPGGPHATTSVVIATGRIVLSYASLGPNAISLEFVGPPPVFRFATNAILESFLSPVPLF